MKKYNVPNYVRYKNDVKTSIANIAKLLDCSARTIHRNMGMDLKKEKELLNQEL